MKIHVSAATAAALLLLAVGVRAQTTGTSHPEDLDDPITTIAPSPQYAKPSPDVPSATAPIAAAPALHERANDMPDATAADQSAPSQDADAQSSDAPPDAQPADAQPADAENDSAHYIPPHNNSLHEADAASQSSPSVESASAGDSFAVTSDPNSGVVIAVPTPANALPEGTLLRASLDAEISTETSVRGQAFDAHLTRPIEHDGKIVFPIGAVLSGRIAQLHGGHRIGGAAAIYLQPEFLTLPGGATYRLDAQVVDLGLPGSSHVSNEGAIIGNDHSKGTMAAFGLTTASAAAAGGVVAGPVGAVVGAGVGAGVDTVFWLKHENQQTLKPGTVLVLSLNTPMLLDPVAR